MQVNIKLFLEKEAEGVGGCLSEQGPLLGLILYNSIHAHWSQAMRANDVPTLISQTIRMLQSSESLWQNETTCILIRSSSIAFISIHGERKFVYFCSTVFIP